MTFFYLSPVKGEVPWHLLETIVSKRLEYLKLILHGDSGVYNEYVVEGSIYDNVGHFMLSVLTILAENSSISQFFIKAEVELFKKRLSLLSAYDMRVFAKKLLKSIKKYESTPSYIHALQVLCRHLMIKDLAQHVTSLSHNNSCSKHKIGFNFKHCLSLISKRQVELKNGIATLPCGKWKQYLTNLFIANITHRLQHTGLAPLKCDPRIMELVVIVRNDSLFININDGSNILLSREVDNSSRLFPPCMLSLHQNLRRKHRLSHSQRFYYSLFLKDIGMPVEEAVDFWRAEYRLSPNGSHSCCHSWDKDEKKYLYGIRHMYGLEGARKNYTSVSCQRIQSDSSSDGGCPFKTFDTPKMLKLLSPKCTESVFLKINELKSRNQYVSACSFYLKTCLQTNCDITSFNFTPVQFYIDAMQSIPMDL